MSPDKEHSSEMDPSKATFERLLQAARREDWAFVDERIGDVEFDEARIRWVIDEALKDSDRNVRDLGATILDRTGITIGEDDESRLVEIMKNDSYHIVRFRIAIALWMRGIRTHDVDHVMKEAVNDPDVGMLAQQHR